MGFLQKLFGKGPSGDQILSVDGPGDYRMDVVGESHYQKELRAICGPRSEDGENRFLAAALIHDDGNPYDDQAVRIEIEGRTVGYLPRNQAARYRQNMARQGHAGETLYCGANIRGGWRRSDGQTGHYGVWLDLPADLFREHDS